ncbi:hypothetical protein HDE_05334 [Halotydeus destructor]|nr:hypothetical protein HDE_05334 [Halotydeus destructor]
MSPRISTSAKKSPSESVGNFSQKLVDEIVENVAKRIDELNLRRSSIDSSASLNRPAAFQAQHFKKHLPSNAKYVELTMTIRNRKENFSGQIYLNTNDHKVNRDIKAFIVEPKVTRVQARGRRISKGLASKNMDTLKSKLQDKVDAIKEIIVKYGFDTSDIFEADMTPTARIREGASRIASETMVVFQRLSTAGDDDLSEEDDIDEEGDGRLSEQDQFDSDGFEENDESDQTEEKPSV